MIICEKMIILFGTNQNNNACTIRALTRARLSNNSAVMIVHLHTLHVYLHTTAVGHVNLHTFDGQPKTTPGCTL